MEIEPFIVSLNEKTNNEYKFSLKSAVLDSSADFCVIEILYKDGIMLEKEKKDEIVEIATKILPKSFKYDFIFVKNFISEERIFEDVETYLNKNFPSINFVLEKVKRTENKFDIKLKVDNHSMEHANQKTLNKTIENYLKSLYEEYEYFCKFEGDEVYSEDSLELLKQNYKEENVDLYEFRKIEVSEKIALVGEDIVDNASYIKDFNTPAEDIVFCGRIKDIKPIVIKRKLKQETKPENETVIEENNIAGNETEKQEESNENITKQIEESAEILEEINEPAEEKEQTGYQRKLYKFALEDFTGSIGCVFFSNKENQAKIEKLDTDSVIVVRGALETDEYSGGNTLKVKDIAYCKNVK